MQRTTRALTSLAAALAVATVLVAPSGATTALHLSTEDMVDVAEVIVTGRAGTSETVWVDRTLVTVVTVEVDEVLKGDAGSTVQVILPGGVDANRPVPVGVTYAGAPTLARDESVVLFLTGQELLPQGYQIAGFSQGKLEIVESPEGKRATRSLHELSLQRGNRVVQGDSTVVPLDRFLDRVRTLVAAGH